MQETEVPVKGYGGISSWIFLSVYYFSTVSLVSSFPGIPKIAFFRNIFDSHYALLLSS